MATAPVTAQTPPEHASHHPDTVAVAARRARPLPTPNVTDTAGLLRDGRARMSQGTAMLSGGVNRLSTATTLERYGDMLAALDEMRMGIGLIESGMSARMALDTSARSLMPPEYLRSELSAPHASAARLSPGHIAFMFGTASIAVAMLALQVMRVRRIGALRTQLAADGKVRRDAKSPPPPA